MTVSKITKSHIRKIDALIEEKGVVETWVDLLATHVSTQGKPFQYMLKNAAFHTHNISEDDILANLTIGEIGVLYEYSLARQDASDRKKNGQFFTPDDVASYMAELSQEFPKGVWLDPCSGVGNLAWHLVNLSDNPEDFLLNQLILSDKDPLALLIARTLFTVSFQNVRVELFNEIEKNFIVFDFLSVASKDADSSDLLSIPPHDFVIINPPYLSLKYSDDRFETGASADLFSYFLENVIKTSQGFVGIVPQSFTNAEKFRELRSLMLRECPNLTIFAFDNVPGNIFKGYKFGSKNTNTTNSIRAAIIVASPHGNGRRITSLFRWKSAERSRLFKEVPEFLSTVPFSENVFPKVSKVFEDLYLQTYRLPTLQDLISSSVTEYVLNVPSIPRYFISALKTPVQRTSQRTLYFKDEESRDKAYLLLNSSYAYWWWRVNDGGMTLSKKTLYSLPVLDFPIDYEIMEQLEESEKSSKVYKKNAGAIQENVKHPLPLILKVNRIVIPEFSDSLILTHENSEFVQKKNL